MVFKKPKKPKAEKKKPNTFLKKLSLSKETKNGVLEIVEVLLR
jgi:hypothetical protein